MEKWEIKKPQSDIDKDLKIAQLQQDKADLSEIVLDLLMWKMETEV